MPRMGLIDESRRGALYLCVLVCVLRDDQAYLRRRLRALCLPGQRRIHMVKESDRRRRLILESLWEFDLRVSAASSRVSHAVKEADARRACLAAVLKLEDPLAGLVIEERGEPLDQADRVQLRALLGASAQYRHVQPHQEPLLWLPDVIAWALGRGSEWRGRLPEGWRHVEKVDP